MADTAATKNAKAASDKVVNSIEEQIASATAQAEKFVEQFDMPQGIREIAERSLSQSRENYERVRDAAQETVKLMEASASKAGDTATALNLKAVDMFEANIDATFDLMRKLMKTRDAAKAVELQVEFATRQADVLGTQAKEYSELAAKAAKDSVEPFKAQFARSFEQFRASFPV